MKKQPLEQGRYGGFVNSSALLALARKSAKDLLQAQMHTAAEKGERGLYWEHALSLETQEDLKALGYVVQKHEYKQGWWIFWDK